LKSPREIFEEQYKGAAAEGALLELRLRLLADKVPELQSFAHRERLEDVEDLIVKHFADMMNDDEKELLKLCRQLRNKILHCDFRSARHKLEALGAGPERSNVKKLNVQGLTGAQMAEKIAAAAGDTAGTFEYVADKASGPGTVFGWLLEVGAAGDFVRAIGCFARAAVIVDRLAMSG
jgi:hypothetical protein